MLNFRSLFGVTLLFGFSAISLTFAQSGGRANSKVIQLEDVKVEGKVAGPEAVFIINLKDLQFEGLEPKKSFLSEILKSVEKDPF